MIYMSFHVYKLSGTRDDLPQLINAKLLDVFYFSIFSTYFSMVNDGK